MVKDSASVLALSGAESSVAERVRPKALKGDLRPPFVDIVLVRSSDELPCSNGWYPRDDAAAAAAASKAPVLVDIVRVMELVERSLSVDDVLSSVLVGEALLLRSNNRGSCGDSSDIQLGWPSFSPG